ncbi:serine/threonine-protein phosphatase 6 regulatory ankyrin repeat subunit B isoform X2 [Condylostylus longicornis]|uniref:serine/threonine-protein phosphatase 6 regulatory ankyrin repeat subunit B isoform X2 n=1 Tax=Condylostylus longicornis TaxID=2530218 RepID=UPI00244DD11D|nr:serine/threonine-protein phosphatase 6 regulatory ankyrin repeat subunit B isoform X2 [Condylostylus longicornis]
MLHYNTEDGKYLASNLADPLIQALTEIVDKRPDDPIEYLSIFLQDYTERENPKPSARSIEAPFRVSEFAFSIGNDITDDDSSLSDSNILADERDEHGQSLLHFACARSHSRNALIALIDESNIDITYRDELYRTARDVSLQANQPENAKEIDRYIIGLATTGDEKVFQHMLINGYDHILDIEEEGDTIVDICRLRKNSDLVKFLENVRPFEERREKIHANIRTGQLSVIKTLLTTNNGSQLLQAKNYYGRTSLHIAILKENEDIVEYITSNVPETIRIGDNLERMPLHYAMGISKVEKLCRILINKGAKRTAKDLKGRQPSYYFINKSDILRLQEEENEDH